MDKYTSIITDEKFSSLTLNVTKYPKTLYHWETLLNFLITKASPINKLLDPQLYELIISTYENILQNFPYLENYHVDYALFEYKLSHIKKMFKIFNRALLTFHNRSLLIWLQYLKICNELLWDNKELFKHYERAEKFIGLHYFSGEFWNLYLEQIKLRCSDNNRKYLILLRKIIELPIYNFSKYFALWLQEIDKVKDLKELTKFVSKEDLINKLRIDINYKGRRGPYLLESKKIIKKFTKELYMVVQFQSLEIYSLFESNLQTHYYTSCDQLINVQQIDTWIRYLDFTINLNIESLVHLNFQRALITLANYDTIWIKYAKWVIESKEDYLSAKGILYEGLKFSLKKNNILKFLYSLLVKMDGLNELNDILNQISKSFNNSIENSDDFEIFWDYLQFNIFLQNSLPQSRYSGDNNHDSNSNKSKIKNILSSDMLETIRTRLDNNNYNSNNNNDNNDDDDVKKKTKGDERSFDILAAMLKLQTKDNTDIIERDIFQYLISESRNKDYYQNSGQFWVLYCHLIFFDPARSYLEKRNKIVNEICGHINPSDKHIQKSLYVSLKTFFESYLPEDIDALYEKFHS